ncbi:Rid family detoxifying hydrolase [Streptomyces synnematoformans]|uniref:RidA family protein n=1 Tax=Streptomyces synnematoformans TaxID=415721 RepID=UPI0031D08667
MNDTQQHTPAKRTVHTPNAVLPVGPFPQAVHAGDYLFISGTVPYDSETGQTVEGGIEEQTAHVMGSLRAILEAAGGTLDDLVKVTIHMKDVDDWARMNAVYRTYFGDYLPARMTMQSPPPLGFLVDIDAIAYLPAG